jgi:hypothetical protein
MRAELHKKAGFGVEIPIAADRRKTKEKLETPGGGIT